MADHASSGFFVLRTPVLPIEEFLRIMQAAGDRASSRAGLQRWLDRALVQEALWLASPEFLQSLDLWQREPDSAKGQKLERALYRYLARMTARATPFGAFAACSVGRIADVTHLQLGPASQYRRRSRLDMEYLVALAESLTADPERRQHMSFYPNSSLHLAAGAYHHLRGRSQEFGRSYELVATEPTPFLDATLRRAASGATAQALANALVQEDSDIKLEEAQGFVGKLVETQVLVSDLAPPVTGQEPVDYMVRQLRQAKQTDLADSLGAIARKLRALDQAEDQAETEAGSVASLQSYSDISQSVAQLPGNFKPGRLIQVDMVKPAPEARLDHQLANQILHACETLHAIQGFSEQTVYQQFKSDFIERYQEREVPLLEALDDEAGIGFESQDNAGAEPLLEGIDFRTADGTPATDRKVGAVLLRKLQEVWAQKNTVLTLDTELLAEMVNGVPFPLPDSFAAMGVYFRAPVSDPTGDIGNRDSPGNNTGNNKAETQHGFFLQSIIGPSGVNLAARFCHADAQLAACVQEHLRAEEKLRGDGAVFAEIAHLPEGRVGNVVWRPVLRPYEIPFLATSCLPAERQIPLSDLTVTVRDDRIILRSQRLQREVLPRLTSAHNFAAGRSLKLYKFLCLLQHQGVTGDCAWQWGTLDQAAFLPRVVMGDGGASAPENVPPNIIFSLARWRVTQEDATNWGGGAESDRAQRVLEWRKTRLVPRFVYIAEFDNQLLIDFNNALAVDVFIEHIHKNPETLLVEMFPPPDELPVEGPEGHFVHEIILPFVRQQESRTGDAHAEDAVQENASQSTPDRPSPDASPDASPGAVPGAVPRAPTIAPYVGSHVHSFMPGSEWLYAKLYCSPSHADRLLLELVQPLAEEAISSGTADGWFFIRFSDAHWHLRLRIHGNPAALSLNVLPRLGWLAQEQQRRGTLWRMQLDTYQREVERYGGPRGVALAEKIFQLDSELCLALLRLTAGSGGEDLRWQLAFCAADRLFQGLGLSLEQKKNETDRLARYREQAYVVDKLYKEQMARKFRDQRQTLAALLDATDTPTGVGVIPPQAVAAFSNFAAKLAPLRRQLEELELAGKLSRPMAEMAESFVHMHLNRMFRSSALTQETMVYEFLSRMYAAQLKKASPTSGGSSDVKSDV